MEEKKAFKPSISIMHFTCPPVVGGVESVIAATARLFANHGYHVGILAGRGRQFDKRIPVTILPWLDSKHKALLDINRGLEQGEVSPDFQRYTQALVLSLRQQLARFDVCIVHNAFTLHFNLPLTVALHQLVAEGTTRFVAWCHDLSWGNPLYIPKMREAFPWTLLKQPLEGVRYVVVSQERQREMAELFGLDRSRLHFVPNGVDAPRFLKLSPAALRIVERHGLFDQDLVLLLPARLTARKNVELAIRVVAALKERRVKTKLLVTGPPGPHNVHSVDYVDVLCDLRDQLGVRDNVAFLYQEVDAGGVPDRVVSDLYAVSDALFFPSSQEGFGIPLLEAGLMRLPVFCSRIPPFLEVEGGDVNYFSRDEDPDAIARRLIALQNDNPSFRLNKRVLREFTWDKVFQDRIEPLLWN
ncbi:MAG: glycosyltransferase family 4 protein [Chloroflexi bacterium]|nr:glycosyltransferase family 4 protein [Chloroflexota bacterium]